MTDEGLAADLEQLATDLDADAEEAFALNQHRLGLLANTLRGIAQEGS